MNRTIDYLADPEGKTVVKRQRLQAPTPSPFIPEIGQFNTTLAPAPESVSTTGHLPTSSQSRPTSHPPPPPILAVSNGSANPASEEDTGLSRSQQIRNLVNELKSQGPWPPRCETQFDMLLEAAAHLERVERVLLLGDYASKICGLIWRANDEEKYRKLGPGNGTTIAHLHSALCGEDPHVSNAGRGMINEILDLYIEHINVNYKRTSITSSILHWSNSPSKPTTIVPYSYIEDFGHTLMSTLETRKEIESLRGMLKKFRSIYQDRKLSCTKG
ncbi:hypothetical protein BDW74DRAFT_175462 [Aspergillus multicolor]|uniref:uncharacterized protein n=1 Tax=Aspergillus multicolor TaxID=41759 RepID=UPI003CCE3216